MSPKTRSLLFNTALLVAASGTLTIASGLPHLISWIVCTNILLFVLMGKDKLAATQHWRRTPEITLLAMVITGATPAMLIARHIFNHKTSKAAFRTEFYGILALQIALAIYVWRTHS